MAAAADGTAAIAAGGRLWLRRGGRFATPVKLGYGVADLAVAPGGWVAAVGGSEDELLATVVRPDGTAQTTRLGRNTDETFLQAPHVGIDAAGAATIAWTRNRITEANSVHVVRLEGCVAKPLRDVANANDVDVAVTPGGRTLLAWATYEGLMVSSDGAPAEHPGPETLAGYPRAVIADDGSAVIAYVASDGVLTLDRAPGGPWVSHRLLKTGRTLDGIDEIPYDLPSLVATLAPDGRAAVAWPGVMAAAGQAGGAWGAPVRQSAVTRQADEPSLSLASTGEPRLLWVETADYMPPRLRGARLAADAVPDTVAPALTTTLPSRTPRTKTALVTLRVPVTCSEACDASVRLLDRRGTPFAETVRELVAGKRTTFAVRLDRLGALGMLASQRARHPRIEVVVTDRAGNVARMSRTVTFRVVDRPLIEFKVAPDHDFAMFTKAGDRAVARLVNDLITGLAHGTTKTERELRRRYVQGRAAIRRQHDEIDDTEVGDEIFLALFVPCARRGFDPEAVVSG